MHWRDAAEQVEAGLVTLLAWAAGDLVTSAEMLRACDLVTASAEKLASLARIEGASIEELQDIVQASRAISAKLALFDVRVRALVAMMPGLATVRDAAAMPRVATIRVVAAIQNGAAMRDTATIRDRDAIRELSAIRNGAASRDMPAVTQDVAAVRNEGAGNSAVA